MTEYFLVEILDVIKSPQSEANSLWESNLEAPNALVKARTYNILFKGWVFGKTAPAVTVELISKGSVIHAMPVNLSRPDVVNVYPDAAHAQNCGFSESIDVTQLPEETDLFLQAVFSDGSQAPLGMVELRKYPPYPQRVKADLERSQIRLQQIKDGFKQSLRPKITQPIKAAAMLAKSVSTLIFDYASTLSDREWYEAILKSIDNPIVDGIEMPGFPSEGIQRTFVGAPPQQSIPDAYQFYSKVKQYATKLGHPLSQDSQILDFGCGWGRIIRFFLKDILADNLYGIDVNPKMVDVCLNTIRHGNYSVIQPNPPTSFPDASFDLIYAFSVFSHLGESVHIQWIKEFSRILKPGGILIATTRGLSFIEFCRSLKLKGAKTPMANTFGDTDRVLADYNDGKFLYAGMGGTVLDVSLYGDTIIPPGYVKQEWTKYLEFSDFIDDPAECPQAMIVMQKAKWAKQSSDSMLAKDWDSLKQPQTAEINQQTSMVIVPVKSVSTSIFDYASRMSDQEWYKTILKSIDNPNIDGIEMPGFPPDEIQRTLTGGVARQNLQGAFQFYSIVKRHVTKLGITLSRDSHILDFGCGWGRIIRFFLKDTVADNLYGIDANPKMVDICLNTVRHGNYSSVQPLPPTTFPDESFDFIYAFSVFSHLPEPVQIKWIKEFSRILKPGGILIATTQARNFIEFCRSLRGKNHDFAWHNALAKSFVDTDAAFADYDDGKFLYAGTGSGVFDASLYGEAIIPPGYVKREWTKYLEFRDFVDDPAQCPQAIIVMQRSKSAEQSSDSLLAKDRDSLKQPQKVEINLPTRTVIVPAKSTSASIFDYASRISDPEWYQAVLKSINNPIMDGIEMPGFPPNEIQHTVVGKTAQQSIPDAYQFYSKVKQYATKLGQPLSQDSQILDFGCGWGRIIRFFLKDILADNLYGIDVNPKMVDVCLNTIRYGNYSIAQPIPPTSFPDESFDLIYAFSVFSHLGESVHIQWIKEFSRILKPGGILIATTRGLSFIEYCRSLKLKGTKHILADSFGDTDSVFADYNDGKFLYTGVAGTLLDASWFGESIIPPGYVKREWTKHLEFRDFVDDPAQCPQAIIVMQKTGNDSFESQHKPTEAKLSPVVSLPRQIANLNASPQSEIPYSAHHTSVALQGIEKLIWKQDRMLLDDLVFRLQHKKDDVSWELGDDCFVLFKLDGLINQYKRFFSTHPEFNPQNIFELGMWEGGSVAFWFEILQPQKHVAIDLQPREDSQYFRKYLNSRGIHNQLKTYWSTNQANSVQIKGIVKHEFNDQLLDLVMDDASHQYELTKTSFETLFPLVRPGGFYIIEDWAWWHWRGLEKSFSGKTPLSQLIFELIEAAGTSRKLIEKITVYGTIAVVERGEVTLQELGDFKLDNHIYRHPRA